MRMRNNPRAVEQLERRSKWLISKGEEPNDLRKHLETERAIHLELGTGKGRFLAQMAIANPDIWYVGAELRKEVLLSAVRKAERMNLSNCRYIWANINQIEEWFVPGSVDGIYLNFSDPWPKHRHRKRRLTHPNFLKKYRELLTPDGWIQFRTDNEKLFEFSLNAFLEEGFRVRNVRLDWHSHPDSEGVARTEYEEKFARKGQRIHQLTAFVPK